MPAETLQNHYISSPHIFCLRWSKKWYFSFTFQHTLSCTLLNCRLVLAQRWFCTPCAPCMQPSHLPEILWEKSSFPTKFIAFNYWLFKRIIKYDSKIWSCYATWANKAVNLRLPCSELWQVPIKGHWISEVITPLGDVRLRRKALCLHFPLFHLGKRKYERVHCATAEIH